MSLLKPMDDRPIRARNLYLLRSFFGGHTGLAKKLKSITNSAYLSEMADKREITDEIARLIESTLELPDGWMDRDNHRILEMSPLQAKVHLLLDNLSEDQQQALCKLITPNTD
jgi:hypothetical protein